MFVPIAFQGYPPAGGPGYPPAAGGYPPSTGPAGYPPPAGGPGFPPLAGGPGFPPPAGFPPAGGPGFASTYVCIVYVYVYVFSVCQSVRKEAIIGHILVCSLPITCWSVRVFESSPCPYKF